MITSTHNLQLPTGPEGLVTNPCHTCVKWKNYGIEDASCQLIDMWILKDGYFGSLSSSEHRERTEY